MDVAAGRWVRLRVGGGGWECAGAGVDVRVMLCVCVYNGLEQEELSKTFFPV